jgi:hypothetical protein
MHQRHDKGTHPDSILGTGKKFSVEIFNGLSDKGRSMVQIQPRRVRLPHYQFFLAKPH